MYVSANERSPGAGGLVTRADLLRSVALLGSGYTFDRAAADDEAVLRGRFDTLRLRPGLILHAAAVCDLCDMSTSNSLNPGIKIVVVVGGSTDLSFGRHRFELGPQAGESAARACGVLVNLAEADTFSRRWRRGRHERKVSLTLSPEWLEQGGLDAAGAPAALRAFAREHLACRPWTVSARARELARQILEPAILLPGLQRLRLESRCIDLAAEALAALAPEPAQPAGVRPGDGRRLARLDDLLRSEAGAGLSMAEIARAVGSNPTSLQALARQAWGCTVFERLRQIRMRHAQQLLAAGAGVAQAAQAAGYAAASNFATAYKRCYGVSPRQAKAAR